MIWIQQSTLRKQLVISNLKEYTQRSENLCFLIIGSIRVYATNTLQKRVGLYLGAKRAMSSTITNRILREEGHQHYCSYKTRRYQQCKYKKLLLATVKDALEIMGFGSEESIESNFLNYSCDLHTKERDDDIIIIIILDTFFRTVIYGIFCILQRSTRSCSGLRQKTITKQRY
jgi:hypothetical protein